MGLGDFIDRSIPKLIPSNDYFIKISTGEQHSIILNNNGQSCSCGRNSVKNNLTLVWTARIGWYLDKKYLYIYKYN